LSGETVLNSQKGTLNCNTSIGFAPIADQQAKILILGSLPGRRSLQEQQYYAHPRNSFWRIMQALIAAEGSYEQRCTILLKNRIALWDVLKESVRPGSMDADIKTETAACNNFVEFFSTHSKLELVCFNGQKAAQLFRSIVDVGADTVPIRFETLPSTSPAYAAMRYEQKLALWRRAIS
jgi:double-stranded uracil-DNA glycosylase